jgi:transposase
MAQFIVLSPSTGLKIQGIAALIETCKLNGVDPHAYLSATITKIVNGHPNARLDELLPWAYPTATPLRHVA